MVEKSVLKNPTRLGVCNFTRKILEARFLLVVRDPSRFNHLLVIVTKPFKDYVCEIFQGLYIKLSSKVKSSDLVLSNYIMYIHQMFLVSLTHCLSCCMSCFMRSFLDLSYVDASVIMPDQWLERSLDCSNEGSVNETVLIYATRWKHIWFVSSLSEEENFVTFHHVDCRKRMLSCYGSYKRVVFGRFVLHTLLFTTLTILINDRIISNLPHTKTHII